MQVSFRKSDVRVFFETREPRLYAWGFHHMDALTRTGHAKLVNSSVEDQTLDDINLRFPFGSLALMLFVLLFFRYFIPVPLQMNGSLTLDMSVWVSVLSFEGASALGYIAIVPWLAKVDIGGILAWFSGAFRNKLFTVSSGDADLTGDEFDGELEKIAAKQEEKASAQIMARSMISGGALLMAILILIPGGIWFSAQWKLGALMASIVWLLTLVGNLFNGAVFTYLNSLWKMFEVLRLEHEKLGDKCHICKGMYDSNQPIVSGRKFLAHWRGVVFVQAIWMWPLVRFTSEGLKPNGIIEWTRWTWWLFLVPLYMIIIFRVYRVIKVWAKLKLQTYARKM